MAEQSSMVGGGSNAASPPDIRDLIVRYHADMYRYAYRLTGNQPDAEDLTQQTFLVAQQRLHQVRLPERVGGWLFAILRNCYLKSARKRQPLTASAVEMDVESVPDRVTEDQIDSQLLQSAIDELPDDFKLVLVMFYFEQCSYKEIAAQLEIPIGTVMSRLTRAKGRLRERLLRSEFANEARTAEWSEQRVAGEPALASGRQAPRHRFLQRGEDHDRS
jgi:RNA polymerase sigma-70 factor (ECF subfamily)